MSLRFSLLGSLFWLVATACNAGGANDGAGGAGASSGASCSVSPVASTFACDGCTVAFDVDVRCPEIASSGIPAQREVPIALGIGAAHTYLASWGPAHARVFDVGAAAVNESATGFRGRVGVALAADDRLAVLGSQIDGTDAVIDDPSVALIGPPNALTATTLAPPFWGLDAVVDTAFDAAGNLHAWYVSGGLDEAPFHAYTEAVIAPNGTVAANAAAAHGWEGDVRFALTPDGRVASFGVESTVDGRLLNVQIDGTRSAVGAPSLEEGDYKVASLSRPATATVPFAVARLDGAGLRVVFPSGTTTNTIVLPDATRFTPTCTAPPPNGSCSGAACDERADGVISGAYDVAMMPGNVVVVAHVVLHAFYTRSFRPHAYACEVIPQVDLGDYELVVHEVDLDTSQVRERLRTPIDPLMIDTSTSGSVIALSTHEHDVAVALRLEDVTGPKVRVVRATFSP